MDDQQKLLLEIQSNASNAVTDLQKLVDTLGKLSGQTEKTKQEAAKASQGFSELQTKIVSTYAAFGILGQAYNAAIGTIRKGTDATLGQARAFAEYNQQLKNVTTQLGITSQFYQVLEARLQRLGLGTDAARNSLFSFNRAIEQARQGAGDAAEIIQRLNVNVDRSRGIEEIYVDFAKAFTQLASSTEKAQVAAAFFNRTGQQQIVVLDEVAQGTQDFTQRLQTLGGMMDAGMVQSANRADKALSEMNEAMKGLGVQWERTITEIFTPGMEAAAKSLEHLATLVNENHEEVRAFVETMAVLTAAFLGTTGFVAAAAAGTAAFYALSAAAVNLGLSLGIATGGLSLLAGLLAAGAAKWVLFGNQAERAADQVRAAQKRIDDSLTEQMAPSDQERDWLDQQLKRRGLRSDDTGLGGPKPAASPARTTAEQTQRDRQALQEYMQALADAAVAEAERSRGSIAGIQERLKWRKEEIDQEERWAIKDAQLKGDKDTRDKEVDSIRKAAASQRAAADLEAQTQQHQASLDLSDSFGKQSLEHIEAMGEQRIALQRIHAQSQLDLQQISYDEYFALERQFATEEYQLAVDRNERQLALAHAGTAERKAILDEREQLEIEHAVKLASIDADAERTAKQVGERAVSLRDEVEAVHLEAFGTPAQQRIQALIAEQDRLIQQLGDAGMVGEIEKVRAAYARLIEEATPGFVNLGETISHSLGGGIADALSGIGSAKDALSGIQDAFKQSFSKAFASALQEKLHFDAALNVNFLRDIPAMASKGASAVGQTFSNLFSYIGSGGGSGVGPAVSVTPSAATGSSGTGQLFSGATSYQGVTTLIPASAGSAALAGGSSINVGSLAGSLGGAIGGSTATAGIAAPAVGGATAGASGTAAAAGGAAGGGGAGAAMALAFVMMGIGAVTAGIKSFNKNKYRLDLGPNDIANKAYGDAVAGAFDAVGMGGIGGLLGKAAEKAPSWVQGILTPMADPKLMNAMGLFRAPTRATQVLHNTEDFLRDEAPLFPLQQSVQRGGHTGVDTKFFGLPGTAADEARWEAMGFPKVHKYGSFEGAGEHLDHERERIMKNAQPGVSDLAFGPGLGIAQWLFGDTGKPGDVLMGANSLTHNLESLGVTAAEARGIFRDLADDVGITIPGAFRTFQTQALEGSIGTVDQLKGAITGIVDVFKEDLPDSIDVSAIAMKHIRETQDGFVFDARETNKEIEHLMKMHQARVSTMGQGFTDGINAAIDTLLAARAGLRDALETGNTSIGTIVGSVGTADKAFKGTMAQSFAQMLRQDMISNAYDRVTKADDNNIVDTPWEKLTSGTLSAADLPATLSEFWKSVNKEVNALIVPLEAVDDYFKSMAESTAELGVNIGDIALNIDNLVRGALNDALQAFYAANDEAEANAAAAAQAEQERQSRMAFLAVSIDQAKLFGDEIRAAELAMEQQTLAAVQANQDVVQSIDEVFQQAIKEGLQQAVIQGMIEAMITSNGMKDALIPFYAALQGYADAVASGNPFAIAAWKDKLQRESDAIRNLLSGVILDPSLIPVIGGTSGADLLAAPGSNAALYGGGSASGGEGGGFGGIVVNVTGNYIGDQATADHLVAQIEATMLQRMQMNSLVGH